MKVNKGGYTMNKVMGIYIDKELFNTLKDIAWEQRKSLSALIRELIMKSLQQEDKNNND